MTPVYPTHPAADATSAALDALLARYGALLRLAGARRGLPAFEFDDLLREIRLRLRTAEERGANLALLPASDLYRTAATAAVDVLRRQRARQNDNLAQAPTPPAARHADPAARQALAELGDAVAASLEQLAATRRPVVRLFLAGYSREEIASLLGWTEAKTRNLLARGLGDLRMQLRLRLRGYVRHGDRGDR